MNPPAPSQVIRIGYVLGRAGDAAMNQQGKMITDVKLRNSTLGAYPRKAKIGINKRLEVEVTIAGKVGYLPPRWAFPLG